MITTSIIIALSLAVDAFAVSIAIGTKQQRHMTQLYKFGVPITFGIFQAGMPLIGLFVASSILSYISAFDHWIAFALLSGIGMNMLRNSRRDEDDNPQTRLSILVILTLALATSIDALAVGFTLPTITTQPVFTVVTIGVITAVLCFIGIVATRYMPKTIANSAELIGGLVLIGLGIKVLITAIVA